MYYNHPIHGPHMGVPIGGLAESVEITEEEFNYLNLKRQQEEAATRPQPTAEEILETMRKAI